MTTIERCPHPHAWPAIECTGVKLTRSRRTPVCMCGHPKAVHEHWRKGLDCGVGMCDCLHYENRRARRINRDTVAAAVLYVALGAYAILIVGGIAVGIAWPLIEAIRNR